MGLGKLFSDPALISKLAANPRTARHLADPSFVTQIQAIQRNPKLASGLLNDPRMIEVLGVAMGVDMQAFGGGEGEDLPDVLRERGTASTSSPPAPETPPTPASSSSTSARAPPPAKQEEEDVEMADEDDEDAKLKKESEIEKKKGAELYKLREFDTAATHFEKAWETWPKDITFLTNLAGELNYVRVNFLFDGDSDIFFPLSLLFRKRRL